MGQCEMEAGLSLSLGASRGTGGQSHRRGKLPNAAKWHWAADNHIINHRGSLTLNQSGGKRPRSSLSSQYDRSWLRDFNSDKTGQQNQLCGNISTWSFNFHFILLNLYSARKQTRLRMNSHFQTCGTSARGTSRASWTLFSLSKSTQLTFFFLNLLTRGIRPRLARSASCDSLRWQQ